MNKHCSYWRDWKNGVVIVRKDSLLEVRFPNSENVDPQKLSAPAKLETQLYPLKNLHLKLKKITLKKV